jgi:transposase-like protein
MDRDEITSDGEVNRLGRRFFTIQKKEVIVNEAFPAGDEKTQIRAVARKYGIQPTMIRA